VSEQFVKLYDSIEKNNNRETKFHLNSVITRTNFLFILKISGVLVLIPLFSYYMRSGIIYRH
jgi:hypothetical protein